MNRLSTSSSKVATDMQLAPLHTPQLAIRNPIRNPNAVLDENGQLCNGFATAHALLTTKKQIHNNAPPSPSNKGIISPKVSDAKSAVNVENETGRQTNTATDPQVFSGLENRNHKQTTTAPRNPYTLQKNATNTDTNQNPPSAFAINLPTNERSNKDLKTPSFHPRTPINLLPHQVSPNSKTQRLHTATYEKPTNLPYLDSLVRPSEASLVLTPDLEPLRSFIMLQHEAFSDNIKELCEITISSTSAIDGKNDSYKQLKFNNKYPTAYT